MVSSACDDPARRRAEGAKKRQDTLHEGLVELGVVVGDNKLIYEEDLPKVLFLERQTKFTP